MGLRGVTANRKLLCDVRELTDAALATYQAPDVGVGCTAGAQQRLPLCRVHRREGGTAKQAWFLADLGGSSGGLQITPPPQPGMPLQGTPRRLGQRPVLEVVEMAQPAQATDREAGQQLRAPEPQGCAGGEGSAPAWDRVPHAALCPEPPCLHPTTSTNPSWVPILSCLGGLIIL